MLRFPRSVITVAVLGLVVAPAHAGITGLSAGVGIWSQSPSGDIESRGDRADVEDELNIGRERDYFAWAKLEHFVPLLPNIKLQYTPVSMDGDGSVRREFTFQGVTFGADEEVRSELDIDQTDIILYYSPLDNVVKLDLGLNIKVIDGFAEVESRNTGERESVTFRGPVPMVYAGVQFNMPLTGFYAGLEGSAIRYSNSSLIDVIGRLGYRVDLGLGGVAVEGGYRQQRIKLDDFDDVDADVRIGGPWFGIAADF